MNVLGAAGRLFCSNPVSFILGAGVGLVALYIIDRMEERRKLESMQKEIEGMVKALEGRLKAIPEKTAEEDTKEAK